MSSEDQFPFAHFNDLLESIEQDEAVPVIRKRNFEEVLPFFEFLC